MKLNCQRFLLIFLLLHMVLTQKEGKEISTGFKDSINKFIEKIAVLKKNMKKLANEREKIKSKKKKEDSDESDSEEYDSEEYDIRTDDLGKQVFNLDRSEDDDKSFDFDEEDDEDVSFDFGDDDDIDFESEEEVDFSQEVDDIEDSLNIENSFLDKLLLKLNKKENEKRENKSKLRDILSRTKNRDFLTGLKEKSQRARAEQSRLSGFLDRFRNSQSNLSRPRFRQDPIRNFRDILGVPPTGDFRSRSRSRFREDPFDLVEENRSLLRQTNNDRIPSLHVNKAFQLLDNIPKPNANDGNVFVFTFADSNNPVLVFDG